MSQNDSTPPAHMPPMAGLCSIEEATKPGLSVEECVRRLKRYHYAFKRLHEIFVARITAEPIIGAEDGLQPPRVPLLGARRRAARARRRDARAAAGAGRRAGHAPGDRCSTRSSRRRRRRSCSSGSIEVAIRPALRGDRSGTLRDTNPLADRPSVRRVQVRGAGGRRDARVRRRGGRGAGRRRSGEPTMTRGSSCWTTASRAAGGLDGTSAKPRAAKPLERHVLGQAVPVRPRPQARRALPRPLQHGRQRRGVPLRRDDAAAGEDADDVLQAAARDRRAGDDGQHHPPDEGQAVGVLPRT